MPGFVTRNGVDYNYLWYGVILPATESYNEDTTDVQALLSEQIEETYINLYHLGGGSYSAMAELENPDQVSIGKGRLLPIPIFFGLGKGFTWSYLVDATDTDVMKHERQLQFKDRDFMRQQIFAALLSTPGTDTTKFGLYDGNFKTDEGISTPPTYGVATFTAAHTHYVGTGSPTASGIMLEDLNAGKLHLREHGHTGEIICFMAENQMNQLEQLLLPVWDSTRFAAAINVVTNNKNLVQNPASNDVIINGYQGRALGINFVSSAYVPANYFVMVALGTPEKGMFYQQKNNPIAQGLIQFPGDSEYPIRNSRQYRWHKFGVKLRDFAVCYQIGAAAGAYTTPTAYSSTVF